MMDGPYSSIASISYAFHIPKLVSRLDMEFSAGSELQQNVNRKHEPVELGKEDR